VSSNVPNPRLCPLMMMPLRWRGSPLLDLIPYLLASVPSTSGPYSCIKQAARSDASGYFDCYISSPVCLVYRVGPTKPYTSPWEMALRNVTRPCIQNCLAATPQIVSCVFSYRRRTHDRVSSGRIEDDVQAAVKQCTRLTDLKNGCREIDVAVQADSQSVSGLPEPKHSKVAVMTMHDGTTVSPVVPRLM
jgi:hypothetical protein